MAIFMRVCTFMVAILLGGATARAEGVAGWEVSLQGGYLFVSPSALNAEVSDANAATGLNMQNFKTVFHPGFGIDRYFSETFALGAYFSRNTPWVGSNRGSLSARIEPSASFYGLRGTYRLDGDRDQFFYFRPFVEYGAYFIEESVSAPGVAYAQSGSAKGIAFGASIGWRWNVGNVGLFVEGGYRRARSRNLRIDRSDAGAPPGSVMTFANRPAVIDFSGPFIQAGISFGKAGQE